MSTSNNRYNNEIQLTWKDEESKLCKIQKLSAEKLSKLMAPNSKRLEEITSLSLSSRQMSQIDNMRGLKKLARLDISKNNLTRLQHLNDVPQVTLLNVSQNDLNSDAALEELRYLESLRTLNVGMNPRLKHFRSHIMKPLGNLQVLVANDCGLTKVSFLKFLPNLNTLILSHNKLTSFTFDEVGSLKHLVKCSLGHNEFTSVPDFTAICSPTNGVDTTTSRKARENLDFYGSKLEELRLNSCLITSIPKTITRNKHLKTLDLSSNKINNWDDIKTLTELPRLTNLSLHSNPLEIVLSSASAEGSGTSVVDGGAPTAKYIESLTIREDVSAEAVRARDPSGRESLLRRYILHLFQHAVGKEGKLHIQLVVLDMRRVKDKWSHEGGGGEGEGEMVARARENNRKKDKKGRSEKITATNTADIDGASSRSGSKRRGQVSGDDGNDDNQNSQQFSKKQRVGDPTTATSLASKRGNKGSIREPPAAVTVTVADTPVVDATVPVSAGILSSDDTEAVQRIYADTHSQDTADGVSAAAKKKKEKEKEAVVNNSQYTGVKSVKVFDPNVAQIRIKPSSSTATATTTTGDSTAVAVAVAGSATKEKKKKASSVDTAVDDHSMLTAITSANVDVGTDSGSGWD